MFTPLNIPFSYLFWHYTRAIREFFAVWGNMFWFAYRFFSISILLRTLFSPWKRLRENYPKNLDLEGVFSALIINMLMRIVGAVFRSFALILGFILLAAIFILGLISFFVWITLPVLIPVLAIVGALILF